MERAYDDAKYGHFSRRPYIDMIIPTLVDPSMAPPGKHVMSCFVQYAPYKLDRRRVVGRQRARRSAMTVIDTHRRARRRTSATSILHRQVLTPLDIERRFGPDRGQHLPGRAHPRAAVLQPPVPGYARFKSPVRDLWLGGSSTHPGGGIMGANGRIAAMEVLKSRGKKAA